jgi:hypothetical protein
VLRKYGRKVHLYEDVRPPFEPQVCGDQTP